jgi:hypothetical protein
MYRKIHKKLKAKYNLMWKTTSISISSTKSQFRVTHRDAVKAVIIKLNEIPLYTENYEAALHHPVPRGKTLSCWLIEHRQGILQLGKTFRLEGEGRLIIAAKKKTVKACSQYMVSTKPEVIQGDANYIGCL